MQVSASLVLKCRPSSRPKFILASSVRSILRHAIDNRSMLFATRQAAVQRMVEADATDVFFWITDNLYFLTDDFREQKASHGFKKRHGYDIPIYIGSEGRNINQTHIPYVRTQHDRKYKQNATVVDLYPLPCMKNCNLENFIHYISNFSTNK